MKWSNDKKVMFVRIGIVAAVVLGGGSVKADFTFSEPTSVLNVSTSEAEMGSSISADGLELYFTSWTRPGGHGRSDIWVATRETKKDPWGLPVNLGPTVNSSSMETDPSISSDGLSLYFSDGLWDVQHPRPGGFGGGDLWLTTRPTQAGDWGPPVNLGSIVNSSATEGGVSVSSDGLSLFFECGRSGGSGSYDIWMTSRATPDDEWGSPMPLGPVVNGSALDVHPDISSDGLALFFQSNRSGSNDLWVTTRAAVSDPFGPPVHIGPMILKSECGYFPNISANGRTFYFTYWQSLDMINACDIWQVAINPIVDFNGDGIVDATDMCIIVDHWGENYSLCDIGPMPWGDGIVDVQDLIVLAENLFEEMLPFGLGANWKLDEVEGIVAHNSVGDKDGFLFGDPVWRPDEGKRDGALEFDGVDDYVSTPFVLDPSEGAFSVFAWVKGGASGQVIISQSDDIGIGETWLGMDHLSGNLMTGLVPPPLGRFKPEPLSSESVITDSQWHHVGFVWDGLYRSLYVDGTEVTKDINPITSAPLKSANGGLYIGTSKHLDAETFFSGLIDDVRIYNVALRAEEIAALTQ